MKIEIVSKYKPCKILDKISLSRIPYADRMKFSGTYEDDLNSTIVFLVFRVAQIIGVPVSVAKFNITICVYSRKSNNPYWYDHNSKIIYLYRKFDENILAHELAHAILDIALDGKMQKKGQEILCVYADKHLRDSGV